MLIDKAEIERVKRANELVALIRSRGVTLTQRGKQLVGLCPFHDDRTESGGRSKETTLELSGRVSRGWRRVPLRDEG